MAEVRLLTPADLAAREQRRQRPGKPGRPRSPEQTHIIEAYKATLQQAHPGFGGEVVLAAGESKRKVRQQLKTAAQAVGYALDFRPTKDPTRIHFRVITLEERAAHPKPGAGHGSAPRELPALCEAHGGVRTNAKRLEDRRCSRSPSRPVVGSSLRQHVPSRSR